MCRAKSPSREDVIPDMENVKVTKTPRQATIVHNETHIHNNTTTNNNNSTHNDNSTHIHNDNSTHIHNHYHFNFGQEKQSYVTPEFISELVKNLEPPDVLRTLVTLVHFNPDRTYNMNIFALNDFLALDKSAKVYKNNRWHVCSKQDLAGDVYKLHVRSVISALQSLNKPEFDNNLEDFTELDDEEDDDDVAGGR
jgi:hypothetical protein